MSNLALRTYHQKIESLIEENKIDKAVTQCFFILQKFPRNLHTYQVLSKALLQKQDFNSADKVFDVILRIDPDDFVSHIGKSMIAEVNKKLDSAVEHMKYAFEIQPANEGLQSELKRLFLSKDGIEPKKIQLTRGALIKMYFKGNLYQQVIAESRIGLSETPQRTDYKIAMAKSFFESGDYIQAVETCVEISSYLPYCWTANEILDKVITKNQTIENEGFYRKRLVELDPYYAFMLPSTKSVFDVPDIAVLVDDESDMNDLVFDFDSFLKNTWESHVQFTGKDNFPTEEIDWDSIITKAVESPTIQANFNEGELADNPEKINIQNQGDKMTKPRKKVFLERLRTSKTPPNDSDNIPNWFFDDNGEITRNAIEPDFKESENISRDEVVLGTVPEQLESITGEEGVFDTDIQPAVTDKEGLEHSKTMWINDEERSIQNTKTNIESKLGDTQEIPILQEDPNDLIINSSKALEGGNMQFAITTLRKLISCDKNLSEVAIQLERAIELYPERSDFRMLLGETYTKLEEKEKALAIFHNAHKLISL